MNIQQCHIPLFYLLLVVFFSCTSNERIEKLLLSSNKDDIIEGAIKAGNSKNKKFINLLLSNSEDWRRSTNMQWKGTTVYQAKMEALQKIFKVSPPVDITYDPDSIVIKFYTNLYHKDIEMRR